jgi:hypothetical protein
VKVSPASREWRTPLRVTEFFLACLAVCVSVYLLFGHRLLTAVYSGKAFPLLDRLAGDRALPLGQYLAKANERIILYAVTAFLSFFFYLFIVLVVRRLLWSDADFVHGDPARAGGVRASEVVGAFLVYSLLTIAFFYPVLPHIASQLIGPPVDNMQSLWSLWSTHQAFREKLDLLYTTRIFYPEGSSLLFSLSPYNQLVALVAGGSQPPVVVYNLLILSTFVLSGVGAFLLIRHFTDDTPAALLGGFVFAFSPSHFTHSLLFVSISSIQFIPLFVLCYLKTMEDGSKRNIVWASVFFLLNTLVCWDFLVYAIFFMVACYGITSYRRKRLLMPGPIISSLTIAGATLLVTSPLIVRMLASASRHPNVWRGGHERFAVDALGFLVPHYHHLLAGIPIVGRVNGSYSGFPWESVGYLGVLCIGLLLVSGRVLVERAARHVLLLLCFLVLSFGANLHIKGMTIPVVLPYALIRYVPILGNARAPGRLMAYACLFLGVLVAIAFSYQLREGFLRKRKWVAALLALGICADFWTPCRTTTPVRLPPAYTAILRQEPTKDFGILDLPGRSVLLSARYMMYQTLHQIPIVQGYLARKPSRSLIDSLEYEDLLAQREQLRSAHVKYIVIHKQLLGQKPSEGKELDPDRYAEEYGKFFEDGENLVLRVY